MNTDQIPQENIYIKLLHIFLTREVNMYFSYLQILEETFRTHKEEINSTVEHITNEQLDSIKTADQRDFLINLKLGLDLNNEFTNWMRQSFILSIFSFLELWLSRDCYLHNKKSDNKFEEIKGKGLDKVKKFRIKNFDDKFDYGTDADWQWVMNLQSLRNCIAHRSGSLTGYSNFPQNKKLIRFINNEEYLSQFGIHNNQILVKYEFCEKALSVIHSLLEKLLITNNLLSL